MLTHQCSACSGFKEHLNLGLASNVGTITNPFERFLHPKVWKTVYPWSENCICWGHSKVSDTLTWIVTMWSFFEPHEWYPHGIFSNPHIYWLTVYFILCHQCLFVCVCVFGVCFPNMNGSSRPNAKVLVIFMHHWGPYGLDSAPWFGDLARFVGNKIPSWVNFDDFDLTGNAKSICPTMSNPSGQMSFSLSPAAARRIRPPNRFYVCRLWQAKATHGPVNDFKPSDRLTGAWTNIGSGSSHTCQFGWSKNNGHGNEWG